MQTTEILDLIRERVEATKENVFDNEGYQAVESAAVESKHRVGFIPWTNGGWEANAFTHTTDERLVVQTKGIRKELDRQLASCLDIAKSDFEIEFPDADLENLTEEEQKKLDEYLDEQSWNENTIYNSIGCFYYNPTNSRGFEGVHSIYVFGSVNLEAPYHRQGNYEDFIDFKLTFDSLEELDKQLTHSLEQVEIWFAGKMFDEFPVRELKFVKW